MNLSLENKLLKIDNLNSINHIPLIMKEYIFYNDFEKIKDIEKKYNIHFFEANVRRIKYTEESLIFPLFIFPEKTYDETNGFVDSIYSLEITEMSSIQFPYSSGINILPLYSLKRTNEFEIIYQKGKSMIFKNYNFINFSVYDDFIDLFQKKEFEKFLNDILLKNENFINFNNLIEKL